MNGVIAMAYGTPATPADLEPYYTHIRRGRPPSSELLAELRERYDAIGGRSPLREITEAQAAGLTAALPGVEVAVGFKHAPPFIEDAARDLALPFARTAAPNDDPRLAATLAGVVAPLLAAEVARP